MGLSSVLNIAKTGLGISQASLDVVARNIANADTPGYTSKTLAQTNSISGSNSIGVRELDIRRSVDRFLQSQLRIESSALGDIEVRSEFFSRIDQLFGQPGELTGLDTIFNEFVQSLQELSSTPEAFSSREAVIGDAQLLAQQLRSLSQDVQALRQTAEDSLAISVDEINEALKQLQTLNQTLGAQNSGLVPPADLLDERDKFIDLIAQHLDIRVTEGKNGTVTLFTQSGNALLEGKAAILQFDQRGDLNPLSLYSTNDADRGVGTILLQTGSGFAIDLIQNGILDSGRIGGLIEMRDNTLVQLQTQLDELAHGLALSLSSKSVAGTPQTIGLADGFDIETSALQPGNAITINYTQTPPGTAQTLTIIRVEDAGELPLSNDATPDPNDTVIGVSFSGGVANAAIAINTALGSLGINLVASNPAGTTLRILDDGAAGTTDISATSAVATATALQDDGSQLPLFKDGIGGATYSGSLDFGGQKLGFASRITVNTLIVQDNELLVRFASSPETPLGDTARPLDLLDRLTNATFDFSPSSGIGSSTRPFTGTIESFTQRIISFQSGRANQAARELSAQDVVVTALRERFASDTAVDINKELTLLIELQNSFSANARIVQAVSELFDVLFASV